jgi:hypothetical protein
MRAQLLSEQLSSKGTSNPQMPTMSTAFLVPGWHVQRSELLPRTEPMQQQLCSSSVLPPYGISWNIPRIAAEILPLMEQHDDILA